MSAANPHLLSRFVSAQATTYETALGELRRGRKETHWMWFIFPQIAGLGSSEMAQRYALRSRDEAAAYLAHPILGPRLEECAQALLEVPGKSALEILGSPDDLKLRSCATLFREVAGPQSRFGALLDRFFSGQPDPRTLALLSRENPGRPE
ncbi:MAG: DUF1810 domain-containing protein [Verrucomicrobiales bacterium]|nr:DUF1810 domain-containing protein [Verrucomicrobiales bacterium]